jgi:ATP-dependent 26S proteasome regulatory subunit
VSIEEPIIIFYLRLLLQEFLANQQSMRKKELAEDANKTLAEQEEKEETELAKVEEMRGSPMGVGTLEEIIDDNHAIISSTNGPEYYVSIMSFVDKDAIEPGCTVLLHHKVLSVVGLLGDDVDPMVSVMKVDKAPSETYADIGGLTKQIQEVTLNRQLGCFFEIAP